MRALRDWPWWSLSLLATLLPLSLCIEGPAKTLPPALLFLAGLALLAAHRTIWRDYRAAWPAMAAALLMIAFVLANTLLHGLGWRPLDRPAHALLYLVVAAVFSQPLRMRWVWGGFSLTAIALGGVCLVQHYLLGIERAYGLNGGASASIELATVLLGLALTAAVQLMRARLGIAERTLHVAAVAFGIYGALLTQSRGPLLAFVPMLVLLALIHARRSGRWRATAAWIVLACVGSTAVLLTMHEDVATRFEAIAPQLQAYDPQAMDHGAIPERLDMWRTAVRAFSEHPFAGIGIDRFNDYTRAQIAAGRSHAVIGRYNQPHNEYLRYAAAGGIPGLLVLLAIFALPLGYFVRHLRAADDAVALPACVGLAIVGLYMLCALTDSVFYRIMPLSFYFFMVLGMAMLLQRGSRESEPAGRADIRDGRHPDRRTAITTGHS